MSIDPDIDIRRTLVFLRRDDEVLLAMKKRGFGEGKWNGAGGKIDRGETVEQAMVREAEEEIDVTPLKYYKVAEIDFIQPDQPNPWRMYGYVYLCDEWRGEPRETEEMAPRWFKIDSLPFDDMWEDDQYWLLQALNGQKLFAQFTFNSQDKLVSHQLELLDSFDGLKDPTV